MPADPRLPGARLPSGAPRSGEESPRPPEPRRDLGAGTCLAIGLTTIVGSGIFALPPQLAASMGPLSFLAFLGAAMVVSLIGLMTAEAAGTTDRAGGPYEYARLAFGPRAGFAVAWIAWVNNVVSLPAVALALVKLLDVLRPGLGSGWQAQALATVLLVVLGLVNAAGARAGAFVSNLLTVAKLLPLGLFVLLGLLAFQPHSFDGAPSRLAAAGAGGLAVAVYRCIFAAGGFENVGVVAGEVKDPTRVIPRAVLLSIAGTTALYALVQIAATSSVPDLAALAAKDAPGSLALPIAGGRAAARLGGAGFGAVVETIILAGAVVSMTGYCAGIAIVAPRFLVAMSAHGFVPAALGRPDARGTPVGATLTVTVLAVVAVWWIDWIALLDASVLYSLVQHSTTTLAAWKLRRVVPIEGRFIAPGGPLVPILALAAVAVLCAFAFQPAAGGDGIAVGQFGGLLGLLVVGAAVAWLTRVASL